jgi:hypothetical protein
MESGRRGNLKQINRDCFAESVLSAPRLFPRLHRGKSDKSEGLAMTVNIREVVKVIRG